MKRICVISLVLILVWALAGATVFAETADDNTMYISINGGMRAYTLGSFMMYDKSGVLSFTEARPGMLLVQITISVPEGETGDVFRADARNPEGAGDMALMELDGQWKRFAGSLAVDPRVGFLRGDDDYYQLTIDEKSDTVLACSFEGAFGSGHKRMTISGSFRVRIKPQETSEAEQGANAALETGSILSSDTISSIGKSGSKSVTSGDTISAISTPDAAGLTESAKVEGLLEALPDPSTLTEEQWAEICREAGLTLQEDDPALETGGFGSGRRCFICHGDGKCIVCGGEGEIQDFLNGGTRTCRGCHRSGLCPVCGGTGEIQ